MSRRFVPFVILFGLGLPIISFSAESMDQSDFRSRKEEGEIPKAPSSPPLLPQRVAVDVPHCERYFLFAGKRIECDSEMGKDASRLASLMKDLPYAQSELQIYRENREKARFAGVIGSVGVGAAIAGVVISHPLLDKDTGAIRPGGFVTLAGIAIVTGSLIYGLSTMRANEVHIANAVQSYNSLHPSQPIELEFSTHIDF